MVSQENRARVDMELYAGGSARVLLIEYPYYQEITGELITGARAVLDAAGVGYDRVAVPGALEIPQALRQAVAAGLFTGGSKAVYAGAIILGCVVRGETSHYDIVCNNTNHWVMETAILHNIPVGNAVLTVDTEAQALARARGGADGKGGDAARACLRLMHLAQAFGRHTS